MPVKEGPRNKGSGYNMCEGSVGEEGWVECEIKTQRPVTVWTTRVALEARIFRNTEISTFLHKANYSCKYIVPKIHIIHITRYVSFIANLLLNISAIHEKV